MKSRKHKEVLEFIKMKPKFIEDFRMRMCEKEKEHQIEDKNPKKYVDAKNSGDEQDDYDIQNAQLEGENQEEIDELKGAIEQQQKNNNSFNIKEFKPTFQQKKNEKIQTKSNLGEKNGEQEDQKKPNLMNEKKVQEKKVQEKKVIEKQVTDKKIDKKESLNLANSTKGNKKLSIDDYVQMELKKKVKTSVLSFDQDDN